MLSPELRYDIARQDHQARIDAATRKRELRAVRHEQRGSWLAAMGARLHSVRRSEARVSAVAATSPSEAGAVTGRVATGAVA